MTPIIDAFSANWWLTITHIVAAGVGYVMAHALTVRAGEAFAQEESESPVKSKQEYAWLPSPLVTLLLFSALVLMGIGVQSYLSQRTDDARDDCVNRWGDDLVQTVQTRGVAATRLETAETNRDEALDSLLTAAIGIQDLPDQKRQEALANLTTRYVESVSRLRDVQKKVAKTRENNPFPALNC